MPRVNISTGFLRDPVHFLAVGFGAGLAWFAPGTVGTGVGVVIYLALQSLPLLGYLVILAALFWVGVWLCHQTAASLGTHDDPAIVWDEIVGYLITMIGAPAGWGWIALGFLLFRLFDVIKPWPIVLVDDKIKGGFGIMLDDALAGIYAFISIRIIHSIS